MLSALFGDTVLSLIGSLPDKHTGALRLLRKALQYTLRRVRVRPEVRKIKPNPLPIELSTARELNDRAASQYVSSTRSSRAEVLLVGLAGIVVGVKVA